MSILLVLYPVAGAVSKEDVAYLSETCRILDLRLVLADDYILDSDRQLFDEIIELPPPEQVGEAYERLQRWCEKHRPDGIFVQSEAALPLGSLLARDLSLPGPSVEAAHLCVNKYLSRKTLSDEGVPTPHFRLAQSADDVRSFAREHGYPLVLKAVASALSHLVRFVACDGEVDDAVSFLRTELQDCPYIRRLTGFARLGRLDPGCEPSKQFLVESFAGGAAVETDGFVAGGQIVTFGVTEQVPSSSPRFYIEGYLFPADLEPQEEREVNRVSDMALRASGLDSSGFSVEMRLLNGRVIVIEVNGRLGWDDGFAEMFQTRIGIKPNLLALQVALGQHPALGIHDDCHTAVAYRNCYEDCVVERAPALTEIESLRHAGIRWGLVAQEGTRFRAPPHIDVHPHVAWALATHRASSRAAYARARRYLDHLPFSFRSV